MNASTSESNSRSESGWTMYWDQLSNSTDHSYNYYELEKVAIVNEEDKDLSMVSDASSGPPHLRENRANFSSSVSEDKKKNKQKNRTKEAKKGVKKNHQLCLDDTASSPFFHFSHQDIVASSPETHDSQVLTAAHIEGEPIRKKHIGFFMKSSTKGKSGKKRQ